MNATNFTKAVVAGLAAGPIAIGIAGPAAADYDTTHTAMHLMPLG